MAANAVSHSDVGNFSWLNYPDHITQLPTKIAFVTDEHCPHQDDRARMVALQIVRDFNPDVRITLSDGLDFYAVSRFDKDPKVLLYGGMQKEIDVWKRCQREWLDAAPNAENRAILGNHEDRLYRYLRRNPELYDLQALELENLLDFKALNITGKVEDELLFGSDSQLTITHGSVVRQGSAYSAKGELDRAFHSTTILSGHTHRGGSHYVTVKDKVVSAHECFCLCDLNPTYMRHPNWQQGITLATMRNDIPVIEAIPFHRLDGKVVAYWRGKEYTE